MKKKIFLYHSPIDILEDKYDYLNINDLDQKEDESISSDIFIFDLLDSFSFAEADSLLKKIRNKILKNTTIELQAIDIFCLSASLLNKQIDIEAYNGLVLGNNKKHFKNIEKIIDLLKENNYSIIETKFMNGIQYYIKAEK